MQFNFDNGINQLRIEIIMITRYKLNIILVVKVYEYKTRKHALK